MHAKASVRKILLLTLFAPLTALALPQVPEEEGWRGYFAVGVGYSTMKSNTIAGNLFLDTGNDTIGDLSQKPRSKDDVYPAVIGELNYTFAGRNQVFVGTSVEDAVTLDTGGQLGWRKQTENLGTFQASFLASAFPREIWEDPYQQGGPRTDTDRKSNGVGFQWDQILGSGFEAFVRARKVDVDTELSGTNGPYTLNGGAVACDAGCQALLDREGDQTDIAVNYLFRFGKQHIFRPQLNFTKLDTDGAATSYDASSLQLTYSYQSVPFTFVTNVAAGKRDYDAANPIFGIKQDEDTLTADATVFFRLPYDDGRWQLVANVLYGDFDSDIDFHDQETVRTAVLMQYTFGKRPPRPE